MRKVEGERGGRYDYVILYEYEILKTKNIKEKFWLKEHGYSISLKVSA